MTDEGAAITLIIAIIYVVSVLINRETRGEWDLAFAVLQTIGSLFAIVCLYFVGQAIKHLTIG